MKEIQLGPNIDLHDFQTKLSHAIEFLGNDMKVRIKLRFKGRQRAHKEYGFEIVNRFVREVAAQGKADSPPKMLGDRDLNVVISPLPHSQRVKVSRPAETVLHGGRSSASDRAATITATINSQNEDRHGRETKV